VAGGDDADEGTTVLFLGDHVEVGSFVCEPDHRRWREPNCIGSGHHVVFPETPVRIEPSGSTPFVTSSNHVVLYDPQQEYRRSVVAGVGDRCTYVVVDAEAVDRLLASLLGPRRRRASFPRHHGRLGPSTFLASRRLRRLCDDAVDALAAEEAALDVVVGAVSDALGGPPSPRPLSARQSRAVEAAKELLVEGLIRRLTLAEVGAAVGMSPFHLARTFRQATGYSLHDYRLQLRTRYVVDQLRGGADDLASLACAVGFASHSHLTDTVRHHFGVPPSKLRAELREPKPRGGRRHPPVGWMPCLQPGAPTPTARPGASS
jgi:AraC-like DNA-binding protein